MGNMKIPDRETVERLRKEYPVGCRIVLDRMDDQSAPAPGTQGTVQTVDDTGSICPAWDTGGSLNVLLFSPSLNKIIIYNDPYLYHVKTW